MSGEWIKFWEKVLCPFCFRRFYLQEAPLRQLYPGPDEKEPDLIVGEFLYPEGTAPLMGKVTPPDNENIFRRLWGRVRISNDIITTHDRICPHCHMALTQAVAKGQLKSQVTAIIGEQNSGKSVYIGVLVQQLSENRYLAEHTKLRISSQDSFDTVLIKKRSSYELWKERYGKYLFGENLDGFGTRTIPKTASVKESKEFRTPLIFRFNNSQSRTGIWRRQSRIMDLVMYDTAGEDVENRDLMQLWLRYIAESQGIIFLIDASRLPSIRNRIRQGNDDLEDSLTPSPSNYSKVLDDIIDMFEREGIADARRDIDIPIAFVFTKFDRLREMLPLSSRIPFESIHDRGLDMEELDLVSQEVQELLYEWGESIFLEKCKRFKNHMFFAISALGSQPESDGTIPKFAPCRVADPILWLLSRLGYLEVNGIE